VFKSVGIVARFDKRKALKLAEDLTEYLSEKGLEVYFEDTLMNKVKAAGKAVPLEKMRTDFIITIGGDGTILRTCVSIPKPEPPILAVNMGVRGFLTEVDPPNAFGAIDKCLKGEYEVEKCAKLSVTVNGRTKLPDALNEVFISAEEPAKIFYARIYKDKEPVFKCQADGLLVATQTGSTGYSLSAGGPVLDRKVNAFVLTPICALTVVRALVFPSDSTISIEVIRPKDILALIDGNYRQAISSKNPSLKITRSKYETCFIRFNADFYERLRSRLLFRGM